MEIIRDIFRGFVDSIRIDLFISHSTNNEKCIRIFKKIIKHNLLLHILPILLVNLIYYFFDYSLYVILFYINYILILCSVFLHVVSFIELARIFNTVNRMKQIKSDKNATFTDMITIIIMMAIYQLVVYASTGLISFVMEDNKLYPLGIFLNFIILTVYHSLYSYNNLWQKHGATIINRITSHEVRWPYFLGYGLIATIIYGYSTNPYIMVIYNMYMATLISIPLLIPFDFDYFFVKKPTYGKINLSIFSFAIAKMFYYAKQLFIK